MEASQFISFVLDSGIFLGTQKLWIVTFRVTNNLTKNILFYCSQQFNDKFIETNKLNPSHFSNPIAEVGDVGVHAWTTCIAATDTPADDANQYFI